MKEFLDNINKVHTTIMGVDRIKKNLSINEEVINYFKNKLNNEKYDFVIEGKNYYIKFNDSVFTINKNSYTIITAHKINKNNISYYNPFRGCIKCSEGCKNCYIHKGDLKRGINTSNIVKTPDFEKIIKRDRFNDYIIPSGLVYMCFQTDFLIEEADPFRNEIINMINERKDCKFLFLTKRIDRYEKVIKEDIDNLIVGVSIENQKNADIKLPIFEKINIKHKFIALQPLLEKVSIEKYLNGIEKVIIGGEEDINGRLLDYDWVLSLREECIKNNVNFEFRQCSTHFIKDNKEYLLNFKNIRSMAKKANIDYKAFDTIY